MLCTHVHVACAACVPARNVDWNRLNGAGSGAVLPMPARALMVMSNVNTAHASKEPVYTLISMRREPLAQKARVSRSACAATVTRASNEARASNHLGAFVSERVARIAP